MADETSSANLGAATGGAEVAGSSTSSSTQHQHQQRTPTHEGIPASATVASAQSGGAQPTQKAIAARGAEKINQTQSASTEEEEEVRSASAQMAYSFHKSRLGDLRPLSDDRYWRRGGTMAAGRSKTAPDVLSGIVTRPAAATLLTMDESEHGKPASSTSSSSTSPTTLLDASAAMSDPSTCRDLLASTLQLPIQTLLQLVPSEMLDASHERFSANSLSFPVTSVEALLEGFRMMNWVCAAEARREARRSGKQRQLENSKEEAVAGSGEHKDDSEEEGEGEEKTFDLLETIQRALDMVAGQAAAKGIDLVLSTRAVQESSDSASRTDKGKNREMDPERSIEHCVRGDQGAIRFAITHMISRILEAAAFGSSVRVSLRSLAAVSSASPSTPSSMQSFLLSALLLSDEPVEETELDSAPTNQEVSGTTPSTHGAGDRLATRKGRVQQLLKRLAGRHCVQVLCGECKEYNLAAVDAAAAVTAASDTENGYSTMSTSFGGKNLGGKGGLAVGAVKRYRKHFEMRFDLRKGQESTNKETSATGEAEAEATGRTRPPRPHINIAREPTRAELVSLVRDEMKGRKVALYARPDVFLTGGGGVVAAEKDWVEQSEEAFPDQLAELLASCGCDVARFPFQDADEKEVGEFWQTASNATSSLGSEPLPAPVNGASSQQSSVSAGIGNDAADWSTPRTAVALHRGKPVLVNYPSDVSVPHVGDAPASAALSATVSADDLLAAPDSAASAQNMRKSLTTFVLNPVTGEPSPLTHSGHLSNQSEAHSAGSNGAAVASEQMRESLSGRPDRIEPFSFVMIDDDLKTLQVQLLRIRSAVPLLQSALRGSQNSPNTSPDQPQRPPIYRPRSSPQVQRILDREMVAPGGAAASRSKLSPTSSSEELESAVTTSPAGAALDEPFDGVTLAIIYFTSLANFRNVREMIRPIVESVSLGIGSIFPEIMVVPKPAGPRRILTALHTALHKPLIDPFFQPIATGPMSPMITPTSVQLFRGSIGGGGQYVPPATPTPGGINGATTPITPGLPTPIGELSPSLPTFGFAPPSPQPDNAGIPASPARSKSNADNKQPPSPLTSPRIDQTPPSPPDLPVAAAAAAKPSDADDAVGAHAHKADFHLGKLPIYGVAETTMEREKSSTPKALPTPARLSPHVQPLPPSSSTSSAATSAQPAGSSLSGAPPSSGGSTRSTIGGGSQSKPSSPMSSMDALEYFGEAASRLGSSAANMGMVVQSPDGRPAGIYFRPKSHSSRSTSSARSTVGNIHEVVSGSTHGSGNRRHASSSASNRKPPSVIGSQPQTPAIGKLLTPQVGIESVLHGAAPPVVGPLSQHLADAVNADLNSSSTLKPVEKEKLAPPEAKGGDAKAGAASASKAGSIQSKGDDKLSGDSGLSPKGGVLPLGAMPNITGVAPGISTRLSPSSAPNEAPQMTPSPSRSRSNLKNPLAQARSSFAMVQQNSTGVARPSAQPQSGLLIGAGFAQAQRRGGGPRRAPVREAVLPPIKVLIVEDNAINIKILTRFMNLKKIQYEVANNGREAIDKWKSGGFHIIFMDIQLPVLDGIQATQEIRKLERSANIGIFPGTPPPGSPLPKAEGGATTTEPSLSSLLSVSHASSSHLPPSPSPFRASVIIVALTASSFNSDRVAALAAGCNDFLNKPVDHKWLEKKIIEWGSMQYILLSGYTSDIVSARWKDSNAAARASALRGGRPAIAQGMTPRDLPQEVQNNFDIIPNAHATALANRLHIGPRKKKGMASASSSPQPPSSPHFGTSANIPTQATGTNGAAKPPPVDSKAAATGGPAETAAKAEVADAAQDPSATGDAPR